MSVESTYCPENPNLIPRTHTWQLTIALNSSSRRIQLLWHLRLLAFMCTNHTNKYFKNALSVRQWCCIPLIPALEGRGRWISEFKASPVYRKSSRKARATTETSSQKQTKTSKIRIWPPQVEGPQRCSTEKLEEWGRCLPCILLTFSLTFLLLGLLCMSCHSIWHLEDREKLWQ